MKLLPKLKQEETKEQLFQGAWIAFQLGAGGDKNFGDYLQQMGLMQEKIEAKPITKEEALAKARRIREEIRRKK